MLKRKKRGGVLLALLLSITILVCMWTMINFLNVAIDGWILSSITSTLVLSVIFLSVVYGILSLKDEQDKKKKEAESKEI